MSRELSHLLAELRPESQIESAGRFSLEASKAREKLKKFQLSNPHRYGVHMVAAAVAGGATGIEIYNDSDDFILTADQPHLSADQLEQVFASLLTSGASTVLCELAIALNAALGFNPRWIRVCVAEAGEVVELELTANNQKLRRYPPRKAQPRFRVHVKERLSFRTVGRFFKSSPPPEAWQILIHCQACPVPVKLHNRRLPVPPVLAEPRAQIQLTHPLYPSLELAEPVGSEQSGEPLAITVCLDKVAHFSAEIVVDGVTFSVAKPGTAWVRVYTTGLPKSLSQIELVQGDQLAAVMAKVNELELRLVSRLKSEYRPEDELLRGRLAEYLTALVVGRLHEQDGLLRELAALPLWRGLGGTWLTTQTLWDHREEHAEVLWVAPPTTLVELVDPVPLVLKDELFGLFETLFPDHESGQHYLDRAAKAVANRQKWQRLSPVPAVLSGDLLASVPLSKHPGHLALVPGKRAACQVQILKTGRPLGSWTGDGLPPGLVAIAEVSECEPNALWDGVEAGPWQDALAEDIRLSLGRLGEALGPRLEAGSLDLVTSSGALELLAWLRHNGQAAQYESLARRVRLRLSDYQLASAWDIQVQAEELGHCPISSANGALEGLRIVNINHYPRATLADLYQTLVDYTRRVQDEMARNSDRNRHFAKAEVSKVGLPPDDYLALIELEGLEGQLGICQRPGVTVYPYRNRRPLRCESYPRLGDLSGVVLAFNHDELEVNDTWEAMQEGPAFDQVREVIEQELHRVIEALAQSCQTRENPDPPLAALVGLLAFLPESGWNALSEECLLAPIIPAYGGPTNLIEVVSAETVHWLEAEAVAEAPVWPGLPEPTLTLSWGLVRAFQGWLGTQMVPGGDLYARAQARGRFLMRPTRTATLEGQYLCRRSLSGPGRVGEMGIPCQGGPGLWVTILVEGRVLQSDLLVPLAFGPVQAIVESSAVETDDSYSQPRPGPAWDQLLRSLMEQARALVLDLPAPDLLDEPSRARARSYLLAQAVWENRGDCPLTRGRPDRIQAAMSKLCVLPLYPEGYFSLKQVVEAIKRNGYIYYLTSSRDAEGETTPILYLQDEGEVRLLTDFVGSARLKDLETRLAILAQQARFKQQPAGTLQVPEGRYLTRQDLPVPRSDFNPLASTRGQLALQYDRDGGIVDIYYQERLLERIETESAFGLVAAVQDPWLRPNEDWATVRRDKRLETVLEQLEECGMQLLSNLCSDPPIDLLTPLLDLATRVLSQGRGPAPLRSTLLNSRLLWCLNGNRVSLSELGIVPGVRSNLSYLSLEHPGLATLQAMADCPAWLLLDQEQVPLLERLVRLDPLAGEADRLLEFQNLPEVPMQLAAVEGLEVSAVTARDLEALVQVLPGGANQITLWYGHRPVETVSWRSEFPWQAAVRSHLLKLNLESMEDLGSAPLASLTEPRLLGPRREFQALREKCSRAAHRRLMRQLEDPAGRAYWLSAASRLQHQPERPQILWDVLMSGLTFPTFGDSKLSLGEIRNYERLVFTDSPDSIGDAAGDLPHPILILKPEEVTPLSEFVYLEPWSRWLAGQTSRLGLTDAWPDREWLLQITQESPSLRIDLGLDLQHWSGFRVRCGGQVWDLEVHAGSGILGVLHSQTPLDPGDRAMLQQLDVACKRLMQTLATNFPTRGQAIFERARQAVLGWADWLQLLRNRVDLYDRAVQDMAQLRLFESSDGRFLSLSDVYSLRNQGGHLSLSPQEDPRIEAFLEGMLGSQLLRAESTQAGQTIESRDPLQSPAQAPSVPRQPEETPQAYLADLKEVLSLCGPGLFRDVCLQNLTVGPTPGGQFCEGGEDGQHPVIHIDHPLVRRLRRQTSLSRIFLMASAVFSVVNRASAEVDDGQEREFHAQLLSHLVGGSVVGRTLPGEQATELVPELATHHEEAE